MDTPLTVREALLSAQPAPDDSGTESQWPLPQPLPAGLPAVPAFDELLLPANLRPWIVDIAERAQAPLDFPAAAAIVALASALSRRRAMHPKRYDDWIVIPNLWGMIVGPPGFLKSPILHEVLKPLMRLERLECEIYDREQLAFDIDKEVSETVRRKLKSEAAKSKTAIDRAKLIEELHKLDNELKPPTHKRYVLNDPSVEKLGEILNENPYGLLLTRDEIGGFLANMDRAGHENDRHFYLESWNGYSSYTYDRIGRGTLRIKAACLSILGSITPGPLGAYLREAFAGAQDDGLIQRFQVSVYPDLPSDWRNVDRWPDTVAKDRVFELFERFVGFGSDTPGALGEEPLSSRFDNAAQGLFDGWRADLEKRIRNLDEHPVMIAHVAKYRKLMPALALIFHLCDSATNNAVSLEAAKRAAAWCDYLESHARRIYHSVTARIDTATRLLGEKIRARKLSHPFSARDVYRHEWTGLTEPEDVARALEVLEDLDWIRVRQKSPIETGGRPSVSYLANPQIWVSTK